MFPMKIAPRVVFMFGNMRGRVVGRVGEKPKNPSKSYPPAR